MIAAIFPGQGSQKPGMGKDLFDSFASVREVFSDVRDATQVDVARLCFDADDDTLRQTHNAQLALFTCGVAAFRALHDSGLTFHALAGHSVGEYAALASGGSLSLSEGARLVQRRGDLMARSGNLRPGAMAAVLGLEKDALHAVCTEATERESVVVIANDNCPGQLVISGDSAAVARASALASARGAKRVLPLNVSGAFHSPLMDEPAKAMGEALRPELFQESQQGNRIYANVTAERVDGATAWPDLLEAQLRSPVRWTETVRNMIRDGVRAFVECGSGDVLCGLVRRTAKDGPEVKSIPAYDSATVAQAAAALGHAEAQA